VVGDGAFGVRRDDRQRRDAALAAAGIATARTEKAKGRRTPVAGAKGRPRDRRRGKPAQCLLPLRSWGPKGQVFPNRFHERPLMNPREVRTALVYVLGNGRKHAAQGRAAPYFEGPAMFTSAPWFDGFVEAVAVRGIESMPPAVARPRKWLAGVDWRQRGRIGMARLPKSG
jgi:hypothetical protein